MRIILFSVVLLAGAIQFGCHKNGTEEFYARHPEYEDKPSYFDKRPNYDDEDLNDRYNGKKD